MTLWMYRVTTYCVYSACTIVHESILTIVLWRKGKAFIFLRIIAIYIGLLQLLFINLIFLSQTEERKISYLYLVHFQISIHPAAFILLVLHLVRPSFPCALLYFHGTVERPAFLPVGFSHIFTGVATSKCVYHRNQFKQMLSVIAWMLQSSEKN